MQSIRLWNDIRRHYITSYKTTHGYYDHNIISYNSFTHSKCFLLQVILLLLFYDYIDMYDFYKGINLTIDIIIYVVEVLIIAYE